MNNYWFQLSIRLHLPNYPSLITGCRAASSTEWKNRKHDEHLVKKSMTAEPRDAPPCCCSWVERTNKAAGGLKHKTKSCSGEDKWGGQVQLTGIRWTIYWGQTKRSHQARSREVVRLTALKAFNSDPNHKLPELLQIKALFLCGNYHPTHKADRKYVGSFSAKYLCITTATWCRSTTH